MLIPTPSLSPSPAGTRVANMAARFGAKVHELKAEAGGTFSLADIKAGVEAHKPAVVFLCQGESSTGAHQSLAGVGEVCRANGALLLVDTVCSLGGVPFYADAWGVDAVYSGSQKCLSAPPGAAPLMINDRALAKIKGRKTPVTSYYFDLLLTGGLVGGHGGSGGVGCCVGVLGNGWAGAQGTPG